MGGGLVQGMGERGGRVNASVVYSNEELTHPPAAEGGDAKSIPQKNCCSLNIHVYDDALSFLGKPHPRVKSQH